MSLTHTPDPIWLEGKVIYGGDISGGISTVGGLA